jgi:hypothetical protein
MTWGGIQGSVNDENNKKFLRGVQGGGFFKKSPPGRRRQKSNFMSGWEYQMSEPGLIVLNDYRDSSGCSGEKSRSSDNHVNPGPGNKIPCRLTCYILFILLHCFIGGIMLGPQFHPTLVPGGEKFENLPVLLKNISKRSPVGTIAFSPDGKTLASGSDDNTIRLWDAGTGSPIKTLTGHTSVVTCVSFSPDGKTLASASSDGTLQVRKLTGSRWTLAKILIAGSQGNWLSIDTIENRLMRGDDSTMLVTIDKTGSIKPIPPPGPRQKGALEITTPPGPLQTLDGQATPFSLELRNTGPGKIYWIRVIKDLDREQTNTIEKRKNPLEFYPPKTHNVLQPGETVNLPCRVSALSDYIKPSRQTAVLYLKITSTYNRTEKPLTLDIPVTVKTPTLHLLEAKVQKQDQTVLLVSIQNIGYQDLSTETEFTGKIGNYELNKVTQKKINKLEKFDISFTIPDKPEIDKNSKLNLLARKPGFPVHEWEFKDVPVIFPTFWHLYVIGVMIFLGILAGLYYLRYFHHPLVLGLSEIPGRLLGLLPGQLTQAGRLFFPAPRLETLLSSAGVSRERYNRALAFYHDPGNTPAQQCQYLARRLEALMEPVYEKEIFIYQLQMAPGFILNMDRCLLVIPPGTWKKPTF